MTTATTFSVIIPTFNRRKLLERAIESVRRQTHEALEIVVVDDGSTDDTASAVADLPQTRLKYCRYERVGAAEARNRGAFSSTGRFLVFLDSDDELLPGWLERAHREIRSGDALVSCNAWRVDPDGTSQLATARDFGFVSAGARGLFQSGSYAVERSVFMDAGGFANIASSQHTELVFRLIPLIVSSGMRMAHIDEALVIHHLKSPLSIRRDPNAVLEGTEYMLKHHLRILARLPAGLSDYHSVAGVASARLGRRVKAVRHFWRAFKASPRLRSAARLLAASSLPLRWIWRET